MWGKVVVPMFFLLNTDLYSAVAPVCYDDVPIYIHCHSCGGIELAIAFAIRAKL